jgi:hypothetical protein
VRRHDGKPAGEHRPSRPHRRRNGPRRPQAARV